MTTRTKSYHQTLSRMQQSIKKFDYQLEKSRMLTHDITIDNKTNKNLDFIIKVEEDSNPLEVSRSQSRISVPQHSTVRHKISTSRQKSNERKQSSDSANKFLQKSSRNLRTDSQNFGHSIYRPTTLTQQQMSERQYSSVVRLQKKFQPLSRIQVINEQKLKQSSKYQLKESGVQTQIQQPFSNFSQVKQQWQPTFDSTLQQFRKTAFLKTPQYKIPTENQMDQKTIQSTVQKIEQEKNQLINLPVSLSENKINTLFECVSSQREAIKDTQIAQQQFKDNATQQECLNISFNKFQTSGNIQVESKQSKQWTVVPLGIGYQNNKKYFDNTKEKQLFKIAKQKQRQKKLGLNTSRHTRNQSKSRASQSRSKEKNVFSKIEINKTNKIQINKTKAEKPSANDLFLQRKAMLIQDIQKNNKKQKEIYQIQKAARSPAKTSYISQFTYKNISIQEQKKRQISPKALQVSERLYSRSKGKLKPCDHYQRFSESIERQRFESIVRQNSFVSSKMTKEQQEDVFQSLRRSQDSVSTWPLKIMNYTYSKLEKINVYKISKNKTLL